MTSILKVATFGAFSAIFGVLGCGPAPYVLGPEEGPASVEVAAPAQAPAQTDDPADRWVPEHYPRPNPFAERRLWRGTYDCPQGRTDLVLEVTDAREDWVRAIFSFRHGPSRAEGRYFVAGHFDPRTGSVSLAPGPWIEQPEGYVSVGMEGQVSLKGKSIKGRITHPDCGGFQLKPMKAR